MENRIEAKLQKQFEAARVCLERMCPPDEGTRRAAVVSSAVRALADYRAYLSDLERARDGATGCSGLHCQLADRAFAAEAQMRMLLAEGINSLNDLRDSGMFHANLALFAQSLENDKIDVRTTARESLKPLQESLDLPAAFTDELLRIIDRRPITVRYEQESDTIAVAAMGVNDQSKETRIRVAPRAGDVGRIGLEHFFGDNGGFSVQPGPFPRLQGDCHQRAGQIQPLHSIDVYAAMIGALASTREAMYGHARKVSQYGHGSLVRAHDPATIAFVVAGVALTAATVALVVGFVSGGGPFFTFVSGPFAGAGLSLPFSFAGIAIVGFVISLEIAIILLLA